MIGTGAGMSGDLHLRLRGSVAYFSSADALLSISGVVRAEADNFRDCPSTTTARDLGVTEWDLFAEEGQRPSSVPEMALLLIEELLTGFPLTVAEEHPEELSFLPSELLDIELSLDRALERVAVVPMTDLDIEEDDDDYVLLPDMDNF